VICLAQVVLSLEDKYDKKLRALANSLYGGKKGAMSEVVERGLDLVEEETRRGRAHSKLLFLIDNAKDAGIGKFDREEVYAR